MIEKIQSLLAGRWRDASGPQYSTEYPADGSTVAHLHAATVADVERLTEEVERLTLERDVHAESSREIRAAWRELSAAARDYIAAQDRLDKDVYNVSANDDKHRYRAALVTLTGGDHER